MSLRKLVFNKLSGFCRPSYPLQWGMSLPVMMESPTRGPCPRPAASSPRWRQEAYHVAPLSWALGLAPQRTVQDIQGLRSRLYKQLCLGLCVLLMFENSHSTCPSLRHSSLGHLPLSWMKRPQWQSWHVQSVLWIPKTIHTFEISKGGEKIMWDFEASWSLYEFRASFEWGERARSRSLKPW